MIQTFIAHVQMRTNSSPSYSEYSNILPFILPQNLMGVAQQRFVAPEGNITYQLPYRLGDLRNAGSYQSVKDIRNGSSIILSTEDGVDITKYIFILLDISCSGKRHEYRITFSLA